MPGNAAVLGEAAIPIRAVLDKLDEDLAAAKGKVSGVLDGIASNVQNVGKVAMAGIGAGVTAIVGGLGVLGAGLANTVGEAMASEDAMADLDAVLQSTGGVAGVTAEMANELASSLQGVTKFSDESVLAGESMLLTFTNIGQDVFPQATEAVLNMAQKFGSVDAAAVQLGKALNDPVEGVTALRRVGVMLTDAQEEQIAKFMEVGDVASAQKVILGELEVEFGGLARAAGKTLSGQIEIAKNKFSDFKEGIGAKLIPILGDLMDKLMPLADRILPVLADVFETRVLPVIEGAFEFFGNLIGQVGQTSGFWEALTMAFEGTPFEGLQSGFIVVRDAIQGVIAAVQEVIAAVQPYVEQALQWIGQNVELQDVLIALGIAIASVVVPAIISVVAAAAPIVLTVAALIAVVALLRKAWESDFLGIRTFVEETLAKIKTWWDQHGEEVLAKAKEIWEAVKTAIETAILLVKAIVERVLAGIKAFWDEHGAQIMAVARQVWDTISAIVETVINNIRDFIEAISLAIEGDWRGFGEKLREIWDRTWELIKSICIQAWENLKTIIGNLIQSILQKFRDVDWGQLGRNIVQGIIDGIRAAWDWLMQTMIDLAKAALEAAKGFLGINSGSKVFRVEVAGNTVVGWVEGLEAGRMRLEAASARLAEGSLAAAGAGVVGSLGTAPAGVTVQNYFGADSVRSEEDIYRLAEQIEATLQLRALAKPIG